MQSAIFIVVAVVALVALAGWLYQQAGVRRDRNRYPAPGELVDLNGHGLHLLSAGQGSPVVVFESG
ncbi:MAG: hypothetical protein WBQ31_24475, partial [Candidatus Acidiferrales bacterium]